MRIRETKFFFAVLTVLLFTSFVQIWINVGGRTIRLEDVVLLSGMFIYLITSLFSNRVNLRASSTNLVVLLLVFCLLLSSLLVQSSQYPTELKIESIVVFIRFALLFLSFFYFSRIATLKHQVVNRTIKSFIFFSAIACGACLLQIAYWDNWIQISLPTVLTELKDEANQEEGREIFGLYVGNTGTHTLANVLAITALFVWIHCRGLALKNRWLFYIYFVVLILVLVRMSVRNGLLSLFIAMTFYELFLTKQSRFKRILKRLAVILVLVAGIVVLYQIESESYFITRIQMLLPRIESGSVVIHRGTNIVGRIQLWLISLDMFFSNPTFGLGFYTFKYFAEPYAHAHNSYFHVLAEIGIVGFVVYLTFFLTILTGIIKNKKIFTVDPNTYSLYDFLLSLVVYLSLAAISSNIVYSTQILTIFIIFVSIAYSIIHDKSMSHIDDD